MLLLLLILLAVEAIAGAIALGVLAILALLGIASTAAVVGIVKRSAGAAMKAFAYQALGLAGVLVGLVAGMAVHWIEPGELSLWKLLLAGAGAGLLLGLLLAASLIWAIRAMWRATAGKTEPGPT